MEKQKKSLTTKTVRNLTCQLTDAEKLAYGRTLADLEHDAETLEGEKKAMVDSFKERVSAVDVSIRKYATAIRDGIERRDVECEWIYHWPTFTKELVRGDTGEIVESAVISSDERQLGLDGIDNQ